MKLGKPGHDSTAGPARFALLFTLSMAQFMVVLDFTIVNVALPLYHDARPPGLAGGWASACLATCGLPAGRAAPACAVKAQVLAPPGGHIGIVTTRHTKSR